MRAQLPITDDMLAAFATFMLLKSNSFLHNCPIWDRKPVVEQLWSEWKRFLKPLQLALERETDDSSDHHDIGIVAVAQQYHGILPDLGHRSHGQGGNTQGLM